MKLLSLIAACTMAAATMLAPTNAGALERWLRIHNEMPYSEVCFVYISHVDTDGWGNDLLGPCIPPGYYQTVDPGWQYGYCMMDMMYVLDNGTERYIWNFNICEETDFYVRN